MRCWQNPLRSSHIAVFHGCWMLAFLSQAASLTPVLAKEGRVVAGAGTPGVAALGCHAEPIDIAIGLDGKFYVLDRQCRFVVRYKAWPAVGAEGVGETAITANGGSLIDNLNQPLAITLDSASGDLFIADRGNQRILRWKPFVTPASSSIVVRGQYQVRVGDIVDISGVQYFDGNLYTAEVYTNRIQKFHLGSCCADPNLAQATLIYGCPNPQLSCQAGSDLTYLNKPSHVLVASDSEILITDTNNHRIILFNPNGTLALSWNLQNGTTASDTLIVAGTSGIAGCGPEQLRFPEAVAVDEDWYLYVADTGNHRVQKFAPKKNGRVGVTVAGECCCPRLAGDGTPIGGSSLWQLNSPVALGFEPITQVLLVVDKNNQRVLAFQTNVSVPPLTVGASCAYGVECSTLITGEVKSKGGVLLLAHKEPNSTLLQAANLTSDNITSPCGTTFCTVASWPGLKVPMSAAGTYLDTFTLGTPAGPEDNSTSGLGGDYIMCFGRNPTTSCIGYACGGSDNCSNSTTWLCMGQQPFGLVRKAWFNVLGDTVDDLRTSDRFPNSPDLTDQLSATATTVNWANNYGQQLRGLFAAPLTGTYTWHITSDRTSELYISENYNETGVLVAWIAVNDCGNTCSSGTPRYGYAQNINDWNTFPSQSGDFDMEAGQLYMIEVYHKEGTGNDHLVVGVTFPDGQVLKPIPSSYFQLKSCTVGLPEGLGVRHNCSGLVTSQFCIADCMGGYVGATAVHRCDGNGNLLGVAPHCSTITCEEYPMEIGSFFMHGAIGTSQMSTICSNPALCQYIPPALSGSVLIGSSQDARGNIVTADSEHHVVVRWWGSMYQVLAGGRGAGSSLDQLNNPSGVFYEPGISNGPGAVYIADRFNHRIVRWYEGYTAGDVVFGTGNPGGNASSLKYPSAIWKDLSTGVLYIQDTGNSRILRVESGMMDGQVYSGTVAGLSSSWADSSFDGRGNYYMADYGGHNVAVCLRRFTCVFTQCRDSNPSAVYGATCGCISEKQCTTGHGALPGGTQQATDVKQWT